MAKRRRYLVAQAIHHSYSEDFAAAQAEAFEACPEAAQFTDEEAENFWAAALYFDSINSHAVARGLQKARIPYPPEVTFDGYRLGHYLFRRWNDPSVRQAFLTHGVHLDFKGLSRLKRTRNIASLGSVLDDWGAPATLHILRRFDMADMIQPLLDSFTSEEAARHKALLQFGKLSLHRFFTEPEPARAPSPWEQRRLARRVRLREVQLHSMRGSLHKLRRERKVLMTRLRDLGRVDYSQLDALADELEQLRAERAEAERRHAAIKAERAARHSEALARLRAELAVAEQDYAETLAVRYAWLPEPRG